MGIHEWSYDNQVSEEDRLRVPTRPLEVALKNLNTDPVVTMRYDSDLVYSRKTDASWIVNGGFV